MRMNMRTEKLRAVYNGLGENPSKEPSLKTGTATGTVAGILTLVLAIFPNLLTEKQSLIILVIAAFALPIFTAVFTRGQVWSPATVKDLIEDATAEALETLKEVQNKEPKTGIKKVNPED